MWVPFAYASWTNFVMLLNSKYLCEIIGRRAPAVLNWIGLFGDFIYPKLLETVR